MSDHDIVDVSSPRVSPVFEVGAVAPQTILRCRNATICVYNDPADMGAATAIAIAAEQQRLVEEKGVASLQLMAAPSAFPFYEAYIRLVKLSPALQAAVRQTHFFQFDDYPLPWNHPASFRFLLTQNLFMPLARYCDPHKVHFFKADAPDPARASREYAQLLMEHGPDLQVKGVGENGHWGFHEPGLPLDGEPAVIRVDMGSINIAQQVRDHPWLYPTVDRVPRSAFTCNVPLLMRTRELIEDNIPQSSKAFAVLATYGTDTVDSLIPSSKAKEHPNVVVRTTVQAAWALVEYRRRGVVSREAMERLVSDFRQTPEARSFITDAFDRMGVEYEG